MDPEKKGAASLPAKGGDPKIKRHPNSLEKNFTTNTLFEQGQLESFRRSYLTRRLRIPESFARAVAAVVWGARHG